MNYRLFFLIVVFSFSRNFLIKFNNNNNNKHHWNLIFFFFLSLLFKQAGIIINKRPPTQIVYNDFLSFLSGGNFRPNNRSVGSTILEDDYASIKETRKKKSLIFKDIIEEKKSIMCSCSSSFSLCRANRQRLCKLLAIKSSDQQDKEKVFNGASSRPAIRRKEERENRWLIWYNFYTGAFLTLYFI